MPRFVYRAKSGPERTVEGEVVAGTYADAVSRIDAMGYTPVWVREKHAEPGENGLLSTAGVRSRDVSVFTRQLASLLRGGVPILRALATVAEQAENPRFRRVVEEIERTVRDGRMLSEAVAKYPSLFPALYMNMVRAGESGGVLDEMLFRMADAREREEEISAKIRSAMAYPMLVLGLGVATVVVMIVFFLPRIVHLFEKNPQSLPLPTRILMGFSDFLGNAWYWILIALVLAWGVGRRLASSSHGRMLWSAWLLRLPVFGRFLRDADLSRFSRTLALLLQTGIPIDRALELSARTLRNAVLQGAVLGVRRDTIDKGLPIAVSLRAQPSFPLFVANMVAVGEESGRLEESLAEAALFYERELDQRIKLLTALLEPLLILVVGAVVGFIVFATLLPVFQIGSTVG